MLTASHRVARLEDCRQTECLRTIAASLLPRDYVLHSPTSLWPRPPSVSLVHVTQVVVFTETLRPLHALLSLWDAQGSHLTRVSVRTSIRPPMTARTFLVLARLGDLQSTCVPLVPLYTNRIQTKKLTEYFQIKMALSTARRPDYCSSCTDARTSTISRHGAIMSVEADV